MRPRRDFPAAGLRAARFFATGANSARLAEFLWVVHESALSGWTVQRPGLAHWPLAPVKEHLPDAFGMREPRERVIPCGIGLRAAAFALPLTGALPFAATFVAGLRA